MTDKNKVFSLIGLATRARRVVSGEFSTEKSVKSGRSHMVIVSEEASDNTKKMFTNMCTHYKVPIYLFGTKEELGHAMGQEFRASLSVEDAGFAKSLAVRLNGTIIGAPQTFEYFRLIQDRIVTFVEAHTGVAKSRLERMMIRQGMMVKDLGTILVGKKAVEEGIIDEVGGVSEALFWLHQEIERSRKKRQEKK